MAVGSDQIDILEHGPNNSGINMDVLNDLQLHPEVKTYTLINLLTNEEQIMTMRHLEALFGTAVDILLSGQSEYWLIIENLTL